MEIRDAVEADAPDLAELADSPRDVLKNMVHDRTVRVAVTNNDIVAFVSFDATPGSVYITQLAGTETACRELLEEPIRFGENENMRIEILVPTTDAVTKHAVRDAGFKQVDSNIHASTTEYDRYEYPD